MLRRILWIVKFTFLFSILIFSGYVIYVFSPYNSALDWNKLDLLVIAIEEGNDLEERVEKMYNKIYEGALGNSYIDKIAYGIVGVQVECPCYNVVCQSHINSFYKIIENDIAATRRLEKKVSQEQCLTYLLGNFNYMYGIIGIESASVFYFGKPIQELADDELIGLLIMQENVTLYNPKRFKKRFDEKVSLTKKMIDL